MVNDGHISAYQGLSVAAVFMTAKTLFYIPAAMVDAGRTAAWLLVLGTGLVSAGGIALAAVLMRRYPGRSLVYATEDALGPVAGPVVNLAYFGLLFGLTVFLLRQYIEVFITTLLPNTPPSVLALVLVAVILVPAYNGVEALGRTATMLLPLSLLAIISVIVFNMGRAHLDRLFPFWGSGLTRLGIDSVRLVGVWSEMLVLPILYNCFRRHRDLLVAGLGGLALSAAVLSLTVASLVALFDLEPQPFALYLMARLVYLGRFFQRVEMYFVAFWFFIAFLQQAIGLYASAVTLAETLKLPHWRPLLFPLAVIGFAASLLPPDYATLVTMNRLFLRYYGNAVNFALPALVLLVAVLRRRRETSHAG